LKEIKAEHLYEKPLTALSGGELQRVLLARAFVHKPKLLILDEPEAGIDVGGEQTLYELLTDLVKKEGLTILTASHELDVVFEFTDQVVCLNRKLICKGKPKEVLNQSTFMKMYGKHISFYAHDD
jgi:zinc transport system ATP-binding protein